VLILGGCLHVGREEGGEGVAKRRTVSFEDLAGDGSRCQASYVLELNLDQVGVLPLFLPYYLIPFKFHYQLKGRILLL